MSARRNVTIVTIARSAPGTALEPLHDEFAGHLERLDGHEQFTIKGKYVGDTALREVLMAEPDALRLRDVLRSTDSEAYREDRIRLGELVSHALDRKRVADTEALVALLAPHAVAVAEPAPAELPDPARRSARPSWCDGRADPGSSGRRRT